MRPVDLDKLARLEDERKFLLSSLDDLEAEYAAGDIEQNDFEALKDSYVTRTAECIREIEALEAGKQKDEAAAAPKSRRNTLLGAGGVMVFALIAGVLLANGSGARRAGDSLTGTIDGDRAAAAGCQAIAEVDEAVECFDEILAESPKDPEALTYKGWALYRGGETAAGTALFDEALATDPTYPDVFVFRAVSQKDDGDFAAAQASIDALLALDPPDGILSVMSQMGLDTDVAIGLLPDAVANCWIQEAEAIDRFNISSLAFANSTNDEESEAAKADVAQAASDLLLSVRCLDEVLEDGPQVDALMMKGLGLSLLRDEESIEEALEALDQAVELEPENPNALLIRGAVRNMSGDPESASTDLKGLETASISPIFRNIDLETIRRDVETQVANGN